MNTNLAPRATVSKGGLGNGHSIPPFSKGGLGGIFKVAHTRLRSRLLPYWAALLAFLIALIPVWIFDRPLFSIINAAHHPLTDLVWLGLTTLGDGLILAVVAGAFLVVNPRIAFLGLAMLLLSSVTVNLIKFLVPTVRPAEALESVHVIGPLLRSGSFPSGHTASSMALGLAIAYLTPLRVIKGAALGGAILVSVSRIFVGAHFPKDVAGGIIIALLLFIGLAGLVWPKIESRIPDTANFSPLWIRVLLVCEVLATVYAAGFHAPFHAESGPVAAAVAAAVMTFVGVRMWSQASAHP